MREALAAAGEALEECRAAGVWALPDDELVSCVDDVQVLVRRVAAVELALVREIDRRGVAVGQGATSTLAWLRDRYRISGGAASRRVKLARALDADARRASAARAPG